MQKTQETRVCSLEFEYSLEEELATCSTILAWEIHGQSRLAGYSPWGCTKADRTELPEGKGMGLSREEPWMTLHQGTNPVIFIFLTR